MQHYETRPNTIYQLPPLTELNSVFQKSSIVNSAEIQTTWGNLVGSAHVLRHPHNMVCIGPFAIFAILT